MKKIIFTVLMFNCAYVGFAQMTAANTISKGNLYAGIEVGSKGVKLSILELGKNSKQPGAYKVVKDTSVNTDFVSFENVNLNNTVDALTNLYQFASQKYDLSSEKIFTVISSGVTGQAERLQKNEMVTELTNKFKQKINEPSRTVSTVTVDEESRLSHLGIIPAERRYSTFLIDIGSGNAKGGYFPNANTNSMKIFNLNWGTKSITNETDKRSPDDKTIATFNKNIKRVLNSTVNDEIIYAVNASNAYAMSDYVAISGGIGWSIATLMYPELQSHTVIPVSYDDIADFVNKISISTKPYTVETLSKILQYAPAEKEAMLKEVTRVHKAFDQKALIGGSNLLLQIMRQFSGVQDKKLFYLVKNGQVGWISAYVDLNKNNKNATK